jgi:ornithine cyclodeaminase
MRIVPEADLSRLLRGLTRDQCHTLLSELVQALQTFSSQQATAATSGPIFQPPRSSITTESGDVTLFMPSSNTTTTGIKVVTVPRQGDIRGVINIFRPDGGLAGLLSASEITAFRTALASMALLTRCNSIKKSRIAVFGAGKQAEWHARLICLLFGEEVEAITLVNRSAGRLDRLCGQLSQDLKERMPHLKIHEITKDGRTKSRYAEELRTLIQDADVICCCTPSTEPLFQHTDLGNTGRSKFISLIGSYKPHMQEIDGQTLLSGGSKVYVDSREACLHESGEIIRANVKADQLIELGECDPNQKEVVVPAGENVVFKCVGMGIMDLVIAQTLLDIAAAEGIGSVVEGF